MKQKKRSKSGGRNLVGEPTVQKKQSGMTVSSEYSSHKERHTFRLFGEHIQHSRAPFLHNTMFDLLDIPWHYQIHETSDLKEIESNLKEKNFIGCAITMPNKVRATACVDKLDAIGAGCGSINTVYVRPDDSGKLITVGTNTDTVGISESLLHSYPKEVSNASGKAGLVYGAGGACRSAIYALYKLLGVSKVYIINRIPEEVVHVINDMKSNGFDGEIIHVTDPEMASQLETPSVAVLTVPDFEPATEGEILAKRTLDVFKQSPGVVLEMCYHPTIETRLFEDFTSAKWKVVTGVEAMIHQGLAQQVLWTGIPLEKLPVDAVVQRIYEDIGSR